MKFWMPWMNIRLQGKNSQHGEEKDVFTSFSFCCENIDVFKKIFYDRYQSILYALCRSQIHHTHSPRIWLFVCLKIIIYFIIINYYSNFPRYLHLSFISLFFFHTNYRFNKKEERSEKICARSLKKR